MDFERRDWVPNSGWPFGKETLVPHYRRAHEILGLSSDYDVPSALPSVGSSGLSRVRFNYSNTFDLAAIARRVEASANVCLVTNTVVTSLEPDQDLSRIAQVRASSEPGHTFVFRGRSVVVAAGGVGTAQLLLDSKSRIPSGVANSSGMGWHPSHGTPECPAWVPAQGRRVLGRRVPVVRL